MSTAAPTSDFEQLLAALRESGDPELVSMRLRLDALGELEPELPRAARLSAIPRDIDAGILGVLRGVDDDGENERLLRAMADAGLVTRSGAVYRFHDRNRATLLRDWRSTPESVEELARLNALLSTHHLTEADDLDVLAEHFARVSPLLRTANRARATRLATTLDRRMSAALVRAVRHGFWASAEDGMAVVLGRVDTLLGDDRFTVVADVLTAAEAALEDRDDEDVPRDRAVLDYYRARITMVEGERDSDALVAVSRDPHLPERYRLWALDDIATYYETKSRLGEALRVREELASAPADQDRWNAAVWAHNLGRLQWRMVLHREAITSLERSIDLAEQPDSRTDMVAATASMLSLLYAEIGNRPAAVRWALHAFDRVRTDPAAGLWDGFVCRNFANLLAPLDERATTAAWMQGIAGLPNESSLLVDACTDRLYYLGAAGAIAQRDQVAERLVEAVAQRAIADPAPGRAATVAGYAAEYAADFGASRGHFDRAVTELETAEVLEREPLLDARYGRARAELRLGMFDAARDDLTAVIAELTDMGWRGRLVGAQVELARLELRTGHVEECARLLAEVGELVQPGTWDRADHHRVMGRLHIVRGEYLAADAVLDESERIYAGLGNESAAAEVAAMALEAAQDRQDWSRADRILSAAHQRVSRLDHRSRLTLTDDQHRSAVAAAAAAAGFRSPESGIPASRDEVRVRLEAAARLDPKCFWYPLELAYLLRDAGSWAEARESLERAIGLAPAALQRAALFSDLVLALAMEEITDAGPGVFEAATKFDAIATRHLTRATARVRQPAGEVAVVVSALLGDAEGVRAAAKALRSRYRASVEARQELADRLSAILPDVDGYWAVRWALTAAAEDQGLADRLRVLDAALDDWLAARLGLATDPDESPAGPEVAMRLDIGDDLIPFVDDNQDDGRFLFELVPELRETVWRLTSVQIPVLRARSDPSLDPTQAVIGIMDAPRIGSLIDTALGAVIEPYDPTRHPPGTVLPWHPHDDRRGPWAIEFSPPSAGAEGAIGVDEALLALIELVVIRHLDTYVTVDAVRDRLGRLVSDEALTADHPELASRCAEIDADAEQLVALSVQLRRMAKEVVPVPDGMLATALLESAADLSDFESTTRGLLGDLLPGREPGRERLEVPEDLVQEWGDPSARARAARHVREWLVERVTQRGIWLTLVAPGGMSRAELRAIATSIDPLIAVVDRQEVVEA